MNTKQLKPSRMMCYRYVVIMMGVLISFSFGAAVMTASAQDDIECGQKSGATIMPVNEQADLKRHLQDIVDSANSSWPMKGLSRRPPDDRLSGSSENLASKIKTLADALAHAKMHYLDVTGTNLQTDEIMTVTELWPRHPRGDLWCITVLRVDGKTRYPRITNRLWINSNTERLSAMLPKRDQKETSTSVPPSTASGSLIPMLLHPTCEPDSLRKRLAQMKFSNPKSIDDRVIAIPGSPEQLRFCDLFALGCDVKDFGSDGDLIWVARRSYWQTFYAEEWFNSRNGKTLKYQPDSDEQEVSGTGKLD